MKKFVLILAFFGFAFGLENGARYYSIEAAFESEFADKLDENIEFYFGISDEFDESIVKKDLRTKERAKIQKFVSGGGEVKIFGLKNQEFMSTEEESSESKNERAERGCYEAFINTLARFELRAKKMNVKKVVNLRGYYHDREFDNESTFECWIDDGYAKVYLKGDISQ